VETEAYSGSFISVVVVSAFLGNVEFLFLRTQRGNAETCVPPPPPLLCVCLCLPGSVLVCPGHTTGGSSSLVVE
jgi:hypothetical protein